MPDFDQKCDAIYKRLNLLADVPMDEWAYFRGQLFEKNFDKGAHVYEAGYTPQYAYFIVSGLLRFYYVDLDGKQVNKSFLRAGGMVGSLASMTQNIPVAYSAEALSDVQLIGFDVKVYRGLFARHVCWQEMGRRIAENLAIKKEIREASLLQENPAQRYARFLEEFSDIAGQIPQYHIAQYLGLTPVGFSRVKNRIKTTAS
ncbi:MAG: Crp/Fnr family transcriptional regulator [Hyphomicrobiales bacterium]